MEGAKVAITEAVSIHFDEALLYGELIIYHFEFCGEGLRNICSEMIFVPSIISVTVRVARSSI